MKDVIDRQIQCLRVYKKYDHKYAMSLNTGTAKDFYIKLREYEEKLSDGAILAVDKKLVERYNLNKKNEVAEYYRDEQWEDLTDKLEGVI